MQQLNLFGELKQAEAKVQAKTKAKAKAAQKRKAEQKPKAQAKTRMPAERAPQSDDLAEAVLAQLGANGTQMPAERAPHSDDSQETLALTEATSIEVATAQPSQ